ncbi:lipid IV(A) 3-deoxy-D-manno-octulosonic acid transferase [Tolumonas lignilytica]|uniref:lipid IV(A) 3-deoxy-D-manno-octulosonic acid transferase n=1 Tax=Tolumonas lignilytica TaxID=1283284 RepID=UPI00046739A0|nr:lipid IV(A) 3-deoxy-D-manno-octulosonic acid transferase [Tolumonas lignilytica]
MRILYTLIIYLFSPFILFLLYRPRHGKPGFGSRWKEHLGWIPAPLKSAPLWIHAVSVGETIAVTPLIKALKQRHPDLPILLTTTTRTGADQAARLGSLVEHRYAPLDYPGAVARFLRTANPRALLIMETELWPNLLAQCGQKKIPVAILNARLSERSCQRYQHIRHFFQHMSRALTLLLCQHHDDAARFKRLGVDKNKLLITGSIKFDIQMDQAQIENGEQYRQQLGNRPVWIAASTHKGEDEKILRAHQILLQQIPNALLVLVPRHPERFNDVALLCQNQGFSLCRRSEQRSVAADEQILLGDSMGEMAYYFQMADLAFMGGSLVPVGGHNLLEPAALAKPTLIGPHYFNFSDITRQLIAKQACQVIHNDDELAATVQELLLAKEKQHQMGMAAFDVVAANQGALEKSLNALESILSQR